MPAAPTRRLTLRDARRIAVRAQLLTAERPTALVPMVEQLAFVQVDPTAAVAPTADLVAWSRLGDGYRPEHLTAALEQDRTLFEHLSSPSKVEPALALVRPMADLGLFLADMAAWPHGSSKHLDWLADNEGFRRRVLDQLRSDGPLASRDIPDTSERSWASTGWTNDRNVTQMLEFLAARGEVAISGRVGRLRVWDLAERVHAPGTTAAPPEEAARLRAERLLRSLGVARPRVVGDAGEPAEIEGAAGAWRVDPDATAAGFEGRTALLSPFDRLLHDRKRAMELFGFDFTLEMYKAADKRRWGYFALPVLHRDRLIGKVDATTDRKAGVLRVDAVHEDEPFGTATARAVRGELRALAAWLGVDLRLPA